MIADDSELVRDFLRSLLEGNGFEVETANDGVDAILKAFPNAKRNSAAM